MREFVKGILGKIIMDIRICTDLAGKRSERKWGNRIDTGKGLENQREEIHKCGIQFFKKKI